MHIDKEFVGWFSVALAILNTIPYCIWIIRGSVKPHIFTWVIWTLEMGIASAGQSAESAGPGAWALWTGTVGCSVITILACFQGERVITKSDTATFIAALAAIPLWQLTHNPLAAIVVISIIDTLGFYPTMRKSYLNPYQESASMYFTSNIICALALLATATYSIATILYPAVLFSCNTILITLILWRRRVLKTK